jgi:hypothetical protein
MAIESGPPDTDEHGYALGQHLISIDIGANIGG